MICFQDKTFCFSPNCKGKCGRQWTPELKELSIKWWGSEDAPIAAAYFCDDNGEVK